MLIANDITHRVGKATLLEQVSLQLAPGKFMAVVGANGAGKSTLLRIISGELKPTYGDISYYDLPLSIYTPKMLSKVRATLPQHTTVNFPFTVMQVVEIGRYPHVTTRKENEEIIVQVLEQTGLTDYAERTYQTLSGGEKQRVQMARIMAQLWGQQKEPRFLLLDEPTSSLDLAQQQMLLQQAANLKQQNIGVLAILHDLNLALQFADQILFLKKGKTVAYGKTEETVTERVIEETYEHPVRLIRDGDHRIVVPGKIGASPYISDAPTTTWCRSCPALQPNKILKSNPTFSQLNSMPYGKFNDN
ncbi:MAG TPA: heme ABC transporter ATP-binding protein [Cytophagales bacterium]|nr:heme ABC transporter ATP-binding protein [Cytophagales bacterium]